MCFVMVAYYVFQAGLELTLVAQTGLEFTVTLLLLFPALGITGLCRCTQFSEPDSLEIERKCS